MNVAEYGQQLKKMGLGSLYELADLEARRNLSRWEMERDMNTAKAQAVGGMLGAAVGAGKGFYTTRKEAHERRQDDAQNQWQLRAFQSQLKDPNASIPPPPKRQDYSFLDDIETAFTWDDA